MDRLKKLIPKKYAFKLSKIKNAFTRSYRNHYYAQSGEDIILAQLFSGKQNGFYVDVGAYHPEHYSNTHLLYKRGWHGINIDPNPESIDSFNRARKRDKNVCSGISKSPETLTYYNFSVPSCNTFSKEMADELKKKRWVECLSETEIKCVPLRDILEKHMPKSETIDLMNIDVEGFDMDVLESNDWSRWKPEVIIIEDHTFDPNTPQESEIYVYLKEKGYVLHAYTGLSLIFKLK